MIEAQQRIVPAAVARVIVDDAIGRREFVGRVAEAADHDGRGTGGPGQPRKPARQADKEIGVA